MEGFAFDVFHHHPGRAFLHEKGVQRGDVGVIQIGLGLGFGAETLFQIGIAREFGAEGFDGDDTVERGVDGFVDDAHAAFTELVDDFVIAELRPDHPACPPPARLTQN